MENNEPDLLLRKAMALGDDIKELESIDVQQRYRQTRKTIRNNHRQRVRSRMMPYAAFLTIPLLVTSLLLGYLYLHQPQTAEQYAQITAAPGSVIRYELPDNSVVWLNAGSTLRYPTTFKKNSRDVTLTGEAYFDVRANTEHPFNVHTPGGLQVNVTGTKFNVTAYADEPTIEAVLETGKVKITPPNRQEVVLQPGEQLLYDKTNQEIKKNKVDVYEKVAWKDGKLVFRNARLEDIFKRLERHFNVDIQFNNRYNKEYRYRATFRNETLWQILDYLSKSANLKWEIEDPVQQNDYTLTKKKIRVNLYK